MRPLFFILTIVSIIFCKTQKTTVVQTNFWFKRPQLSEIVSIEQQSGGTRIYKTFKIGVVKDYFPDAEMFSLAQPLLYLRDTSTVGTSITYFFSEPDSLVRLVEYSWDASRGKHNLIESLYESNKTSISKSLQKEGNETTEIHDEGSEKTIVWQRDSVHIKQFMLIEGKPSRTRALISWKAVK